MPIEPASEISLTRLATLLAVTFFLAGAAAVSVLARDSVPALRSDMQARVAPPSVVANREGKTDKLPVVPASLARLEPEAASPGEPLRQAFVPDSAEIAARPSLAAPVAIPGAPPQKAKIDTKPEPKVAAKPPAQKSYALLSDAQITAIRGRLNLSPSQEYYWPSVEGALRAVARKIHASRQANPNATGVPIDPESAEVQQLKSAAMPLLFQLREDQKQEVRSLARLIGLHAVAAQI